MIYNKYEIGQNSDIIKLKEDLMASSTSVTTKSEIDKSVREILNTEFGELYKNNIRRILEVYYNYKKIEFPRKIFYKKIQWSKKGKIKLIKGEKKTVMINYKNYDISFNNDYSLIISEKINGKKVTNIPKSNCNQDMEVDIGNIKIQISKYYEIENDGVYQMDNFTVNQFSSEDVSVIYSHLGDKKDQDYKISIIEAKLSPNKISDLIKQFRKDSLLLKMKGIANGILLGFFNSDKIQIEKYRNNLKDINCVIYGIKHSMLNGKNVKFFIDWDLIKKIDELSAQIQEIKDYVKPKKDNQKEKDNKMELKKENIGSDDKKNQISSEKENNKKNKEEYFEEDEKHEPIKKESNLDEKKLLGGKTKRPKNEDSEYNEDSEDSDDA